MFWFNFLYKKLDEYIFKKIRKEIKTLSMCKVLGEEIKKTYIT